MRRLTAAIAFLWAGIESSGANYCRPEWRESIHVPQCLQGYSEGWSSVEVWFLIIATAIIFFMLGTITTLPGKVDKAEVRKKIKEAIKGRQDEAVTHGRDKKLSKPIDATEKSVIAALERMGLA
jgi:low affinity Fe/Cu permease